MDGKAGPTFYGAESVRRALNWPMVNEAVEVALKAVARQPPQQMTNEGGSSESYVCQPDRSFTVANNNPSQLLLTMPAFVGNYKLTCGGERRGGAAAAAAATADRSTLACKLVTSFRGNQDLEPPLPSIAANILLFNERTGQLEAIMEATDITTWRTVSASLLATKYLYFRRFGEQAEHQLDISVAIIGCGTQGQLHAVAMCANFRVKRLHLYNRTESRAQEFARQLGEQLASERNSCLAGYLPQIEVFRTPAEALQDCDVVCVATFAKEPLIHTEHLPLKCNIHINAVGAGEQQFSEISKDVYRRSQVYVDCMANAKQELKGFPTDITAELGAIIYNGNYPAPESLTIFQSMGMASEDACVAAAVQLALEGETESPSAAK